MPPSLSTLAAVFGLAADVRYLGGHFHEGRYVVRFDASRSEQACDFVALLARLCEACDDELQLLVRSPTAPGRYQFELVGTGDPADLAIWVSHLGGFFAGIESAEDTVELADGADETHCQ